MDELNPLPDELFAWVTEVDGRRSLIGTMTQVGHTPLIFATRQGAEMVETIARMHGEALGQPVKLICFALVETLREFPA